MQELSALNVLFLGAFDPRRAREYHQWPFVAQTREDSGKEQFRFLGSFLQHSVHRLKG
jgi:hypothetical protein